MIVRRLKLRWRDVTDRLEQPAMIEPINPFQRRVFNRVQMTPRPATSNHLGFVEPNDGLRERVIVRIADATHRRLGACLGQSIGVANRQVLGGFNSSSQHVLMGGCDEYKEAAVGSGWTCEDEVSRTASGAASSGATPVLACDRRGLLERRGSSKIWGFISGRC